MLAQLEVSKTYGQFVPYAAAIYRTFAFADSDFDYTQIDLNLGSAISWSKQGSVYVEYTVQMFSLKNSSADPQNYTSNQFGAGVSYNL
jgi:outer membrane autotransporter protein